MTCVRVSAPHFVAGIDSEGLCAPIIAYMRGWSDAQIIQFCFKKGWSVEFLNDEELAPESSVSRSPGKSTFSWPSSKANPSKRLDNTP